MGQLDTLKQALYKKLGDKMMAKVYYLSWDLCMSSHDYHGTIHYTQQQSLSKESPERGEVKFIEKNLDELSRMHKKVCVCVCVSVTITHILFWGFLDPVSIFRPST